MKTNSQEIKSFFDKFAQDYDQMAFKRSLGIDFLNFIEREFIKENLSIKKGQRLLDLGIGTGRNSSLFEKKGIKIYGVDISRKMIQFAQKRLRDKETNIIISDISKKLPFKDNFFDAIICFRVLKYITNWPETLKEVQRITKKGGFFVLSVPNMFSIQSIGLYSANYRVFNPFYLEKKLKESGFKILKISQGSRLPFPLYKRINSKIILKILVNFEKTLSIIFPKKFLSRSLFYLCKKK